MNSVKPRHIQRVSTLLLRGALLLITLAVLAADIILLPLLWGDIGREYPRYAYAVYAVFVTLYITSIPYFYGVYKAWRLLTLITKGQTFSAVSVKTVRTIAICAGLISFIYCMSLPFFYIWADNDDAPGLIIIAMVLVGAPLVVPVFAALLRQLLSEAVLLKSENELTV